MHSSRRLVQGVSVADGRNWFLRFLFYWTAVVRAAGADRDASFTITARLCSVVFNAICRIILYQIIPISLYVFFEIAGVHSKMSKCVLKATQI